MKALLANRLVLWALPTLLLGVLAYRLVFPVHSGQTNEAASTTPREYEIGGLVISAEALRFGEVWEKKDFTWELPVRNVTKEPIQITDWSASCNCLDVQPRSVRIPAHQTSTVRLALDLTARRPHEATLARRQLAYEIMPVFADGRRLRPRAWRVEGVARSKLTLDALYVHFGESPVHGEEPVARKVMGNVHVPFQRLETVVDAKRLDVRLRQFPDSPKRFELLVSPQPTLPPGPFRAEVVLNIITAEGKRERGLVLPVEGEMQPGVRLLPARLLLPTKRVGETATGVLTLQVPSRLPVVVEQIESSSADLHVEAIPLEGVPSGRGFRVSQRITRAGDHTSHVTFTLRSCEQLTRIPVEVFARGEDMPEEVETKGNR
jgi:hypothetical protein